MSDTMNNWGKMLRSFDNSKEFLDIETLIVKASDSSPNTHGWYKIVNRDLTALFVKDNGLVFKHVNSDFVISNLYSAKSMHVKDDIYTFQLFNENTLTCEFYYHADKSLFNIQPFDYIEEENFDWGLFLSNLINSPERQKVFLLHVNSYSE